MGQTSFMVKHRQDASEIFGFSHSRPTLSFFTPR
jgi:hypothetical protein